MKEVKTVALIAHDNKKQPEIEPIKSEFSGITFSNEFAEQICSVALIFIMFYGGFGTNWKDIDADLIIE